MRIFTIAIAIIVGVQLAGCAMGSGRDAAETVASDNGIKATYRCSDGALVEAWYPTTSTARLRYQGQSIEMTSAISASGARYVGSGWQWWTKGATEGLLSPLAEGESIASASGMTCTMQ